MRSHWEGSGLMQIDPKTLIGEATEYDKKRSVERKQVKSWLKGVSAFANSFGGTLIWGITNDDEVVGLENAESDAEFISETIKTKIDSIPKVNLRFHIEDNKKLILLDVYAGKETPYYYVGEGNMTAYIRLGNESVLADNITLKRLVLQGTTVLMTVWLQIISSRIWRLQNYVLYVSIIQGKILRIAIMNLGEL